MEENEGRNPLSSCGQKLTTAKGRLMFHVAGGTASVWEAMEGPDDIDCLVQAGDDAEEPQSTNKRSLSVVSLRRSEKCDFQIESC